MAAGELASLSGLRPFLDREEVLMRTVEQLRKDLSVKESELVVPAVGESAFEELRKQVLPVLERLQQQGVHPFQVAMYRVDIPEKHLIRTMQADGMRAVAGEVVLRCLQKVLTRQRFAGLGQ